MTDETGRAARRAQLGAFLRARRARLEALPTSGCRRVGRWASGGLPGLRREEVAQLSGVGVTWYTWLEQGRDIAASPQVIDALARALALTGDEHQHLRALTSLPAPENATAAGEELPRLQRLVDAAAPNIACVYDLHFDYLAWNVPYARIRHDPGQLPSGVVESTVMMFTDAANRARMLRWEQAARTVPRPVPRRCRAAARRSAVRGDRRGAQRSQHGIPGVVGRLPGPGLPAPTTGFRDPEACLSRWSCFSSGWPSTRDC